jgi:hypothetical protein
VSSGLGKNFVGPVQAGHGQPENGNETRSFLHRTSTNDFSDSAHRCHNKKCYWGLLVHSGVVCYLECGIIPGEKKRLPLMCHERGLSRERNEKNGIVILGMDCKKTKI